MIVQTRTNADFLYKELNHRFRLQKVAVEFGAYSLELIKVADLDELLEGVTDADPNSVLGGIMAGVAGFNPLSFE